MVHVEEELAGMLSALALERELVDDAVPAVGRVAGRLRAAPEHGADAAVVEAVALRAAEVS